MKPTDAPSRPADWRAISVSEAAQIKRGVSWSKEQELIEPREGTVAVVGVSNVQERLKLDGLIYLSGLKPKAIEAKRVSAGWSLVVGSNGNRNRIGNAVLIDRDQDLLFASFLIAATPKPESGITPEFFYRWLSSERVQAYITASAEGTTGLSNLSHSFFRAMQIAYPEPAEQAAITRVLESVDSAIERAQDAAQKAKALDHTILNQLVESGMGAVAGAKRPAFWQMRRVDEVAEVGSGVTLGKDVTGFKHVELPYLRVANVQDGHLDLRTIKTVKVRVNDVESFRLLPGDVLMTEGGDLDKLGRGTLWEGQIADCLHQNHIFRIRADATQLLPRYFSYVVESDIAKRYFNRVAKRTTNLASTNKTQVRAFTFPLPPLKEQEQIAEIIRVGKTCIAALDAKVAALRDLKKSLLHDLLTGTKRLDPSRILDAA